MASQTDSATGASHPDAERPEPPQVPTDNRRPAHPGIDTDTDAQAEPLPPPGTDAARDIERRTLPARTRGGTEI